MTSSVPGQRKTVSILFCDLVGSTALGSSHDPEVLRSVMELYVQRCRSVVERHGGVVEKFIGDAVVGVFGVPTLHEDDALRAVRASADLVLAVRELGKELQERMSIELAVRIGVNTGEVVAGSGVEALMSCDAANVAARLEQAAEAGEVLIGAITRALVRDEVELEALDPITVKGKVEPLPVFRLVGVRPLSVGSRRRRFAGPLVGRTHQLRLAEALFAAAVEESSCVMLTVLGEPGVGKSRLVDEVLTAIGPGAQVLQGRCLPYGEGITYWPIREMLIGLAERDPRSWRDHLVGVAHAPEVVAGLETLLGAADTAAGHDMRWAFRRLVETLATDRPVVLVFDDVQWAEPGLLDLIDHLTDMSRTVPILVVCMARPEFQQTRPGWGAGRPHALTMALRPLSDAECRNLTVHLFGRGVGTVLLEKVVTSAEGVPLFVEELLAMLVDEGRLVQDQGGGWRAAPGHSEVVVPPSVQALVAGRLDGLGPELREIVDVAAVIGKTFYPDAVVVLTGHGSTAVDDRIAALVRADLVQPVTSDIQGLDAFTFSHLLLQDAAYHAMTKSRRAQTHAVLADWLESQPPGAVSPEVVAFHLEAAALYRAELGSLDTGLELRAAQLLLTTANRAVSLADGAAAYGLATRAERLTVPPSPLRAEILLTLSEAAMMAGDVRGAPNRADDAERIGRELGDEALQWAARLQKRRVDIWTQPTHDVAEAMLLADRAIAALAPDGDAGALAAAYALRADYHNMSGQERACADDAATGLRYARRTGRAGTYFTRLIRSLSSPYFFGEGTAAQMEAAFSDLLADMGVDPRVSELLFADRELLRAFDRDVGEATALALAQHAWLVDKGSLWMAASTLTWRVAWCQRWSGDLATAAATMQTATAQYERLGETGGRSSTLAELSLRLTRLGRDDEARAALDESRAITSRGDLLNDMHHAAAEGMLRAHVGDADGARRLFENSLRIASGTEFAVDHGDLWLARSEAQAALGDQAGAVDSAQEALAILRRKGMAPPIRVAEAQLAAVGA